MTQLNNEDLLLNLYKIHAYIPNDADGNPLTPFGNFCAGYEAAKADSEREITELKTQNSELSASINVLREALERSSKSLEAIDFDWECEHGFHQDKCPNPVCEVKAYWDAIAIGKKALFKTPAQSLQAHDNEVIERCAKVVTDDVMAVSYQSTRGYRNALIQAIRALKGK